MKLVEIENLTVDYQGILALDKVNFSVESKDFLGIIGPNGAGKTTLFNCMLGLLNNYKGEIRFFGTSIRKSKQYLHQIGYVPQKPVFEKNFPATVSEVVGMGLTKNPRNDKIDGALQKVWLHELSHRRIGDLSGGQQQRVFIAKALVNDPQILILDEPVTGIDSQSKATTPRWQASAACRATSASAGSSATWTTCRSRSMSCLVTRTKSPGVISSSASTSSSASPLAQR